MRAFGLAVLTLAATASMAVGATVRRPVSLTSKNCCDNCTVARYVPPSVPVVASTMVTGALLVEASLASAAMLAVLAVRSRRRPPTASPQPAPPAAAPES